MAEGVVTSEGIFGLAEYPLHLSTEAKLQLREKGAALQGNRERPMATTHQAAEMQGRPSAAASEFHRQLEVKYLSRDAQDVQDSEGDVGL